MSDGFDRAPGAGRGRSRGLGRGGGGPEGGGFPNGAGAAERPRHQPPPQPKAPGFLQPPPLRQPRTAPPPGAQCEVPAGPQRPPRPGALPEQTRPLRAPPSSQDNIPQQNLESAMAKPQVVVAPVLMSKLSVNAPEFYPSGYSSNYTSTSGGRAKRENPKQIIGLPTSVPTSYNPFSTQLFQMLVLTGGVTTRWGGYQPLSIGSKDQRGSNHIQDWKRPPPLLPVPSFAGRSTDWPPEQRACLGGTSGILERKDASAA
ncbi:polyadenylate-binding protein-interacting protein 1 [Lynx canadensis]|uniref:polyadenylate-binding protein-interacting protein 1 n=1 Tax=Lynx canadensis TaxID=61383 RepID=UPI0011AFFD19|nr:polyadenylate-binding protein-interacting protein 1 [Lynx canadensis]